MRKNIIERAITPVAKRLFTQYPIITITGPRQSGKTTFVRHVFMHLPYINLENMEERQFASDDPKRFLNRYSTGAVIDEVQNVPELTSWIQVHVDELGGTGHFVLTGSRQFEVMESVSQSLAGRTAMLRLLPFSFEELFESTSTPDYDTYLYRGFYPRIYDQGIEPSIALSDYITTYIERDLRKLSQIHNLNLFNKFLGLCAGRIGQVLNLTSLANDTGISHTTASEWLTLLQASYIVYLLKPYHGNQNKRLIKSPKLYFFDTGLVARLLNIERVDHLFRHPLRGNLFENLVIGELLKYRYNRALPDTLYFYRDNKGNEVDVIYTVGGLPYPIEVKSGSTLNTDYFKNLQYFLTKAAEPNPFTKNNGLLIYAGDRHEERNNIRVTHPARTAEDLAALEK